MKLIETINDIDSEGIFHLIASLGYISWLNSIASTLDFEYYYGHSGEKEVTPLVVNLKTKIGENYKTKLAEIINNKFKDKWLRLYDTFIAKEYNPIHNYNMSETENQSTDIITETNEDSGYVGFNVEKASKTNELIKDSAVRGDADKNERTLVKSGNIGVTTTQKMIKEELELRQWNLYKIMFEDVDSVLTLRIY